MKSFPSVFRKAAKVHRCVECRRSIAVGERHVVISGVVDGHAWSDRSCLRCERAYERAARRFGGWTEDDAPCFGGLASWMWERRHYGKTLHESPIDVVRRRRARMLATKGAP